MLTILTMLTDTQIIMTHKLQINHNSQISKNDVLITNEYVGKLLTNKIKMYCRSRTLLLLHIIYIYQ